MEQIRIAFLTASPADLPRVNVEAEFKFIEGELDRSDQRDRFDFRFVPAVGRADLLRQLLKLRPHLVHFSGHGSDFDEIFLEGQDGAAEPMSAEELERVFTIIPAEVRPKVVILSACYSRHQADALTRVVDYAVGMSQAIHDSSAFAFAQGFYLAVGRGLAVDQAVEAGRLAMPGTDATRKLPHLHVRDGADSRTGHLLGAGPVSRFPEDLHIDRAAQLERFRGMLARGDPRVLIVTAAGNMGKSRLITAMAREAKAHPVGHADLTRRAGSPETVLRRLSLGLGAGGAVERPMPSDLAGPLIPENVPVDPSLVVQRQAELIRLTDELVDTAKRAATANDHRAVLLLDGFDESSGEIATWVEDILLPAIIYAEQVVCVIAGRAEPSLEIALHLVGRERLDNFAERDVREVLEQLHLDASAATTTWVTTDNGNPFLTVQHIEKLWRHAIASER